MSERLVDLKNARVDLGIRIADLKSVEDIKRSKLVTVLDEFSAPGNNIYTVYTERRHLPAKVRLFIDFLKKMFDETPYWE